jgi:hypothetical protein
MNVLHSPAPRQSIGKNVGNLKRPAEVTPVPNTTAKRGKYVPMRIAKMATESASDRGYGGKRKSKPNPNFFQDVYDLLEQSTLENSKLIRWTDDGKAFHYDDKNLGKLTQWLTKFGTYRVVGLGRVF